MIALYFLCFLPDDLVIMDPALTPAAPPITPSDRKSFTRFLPWILILLLIAALAVVIVLWKPWQASIPANSRTVDVTGTATVKAEPDEFVFSPTYQFKGADKNALIAELTKKSDEVVAQLKKLGVADNKIKTNASGYSANYYYDASTGDSTYTLSINAIVNDKQLSQKVQDYLTTTGPEGSVTPQATFSTAKQKELQSKARDDATKDARSKADRSAKNLGFIVGEVKSVTDGELAFPLPYAVNNSIQAMDVKEGSTSPPSLTIHPGENELSYSVKVVYFIK